MQEPNANKCIDAILREHDIDPVKAKSNKGGGYEKAWKDKVKVWVPLYNSTNETVKTNIY